MRIKWLLVLPSYGKKLLSHFFRVPIGLSFFLPRKLFFWESTPIYQAVKSAHGIRNGSRKSAFNDLQAPISVCPSGFLFPLQGNSSFEKISQIVKKTHGARNSSRKPSFDDLQAPILSRSSCISIFSSSESSAFFRLHRFLLAWPCSKYCSAVNPFFRKVSTFWRSCRERLEDKLFLR